MNIFEIINRIINERPVWLSMALGFLITGFCGPEATTPREVAESFLYLLASFLLSICVILPAIHIIFEIAIEEAKENEK